jgi:uncharacterized protein
LVEMTGRLEEGFRHRFRQLLALVRPRRLEFGVELLMGRARRRSEREGQPLVQALADLYEFTRKRVVRRVELTGACSVVNPPWARFDEERPPRFMGDRSLLGLLRWLRAAGYEARQVRPAEGLAAAAADSGLVLLTTDAGILDRRVVREEKALVLWLPSTLGLVGQLAMVLRDLGLRPRQARCMACGGPLVPTNKEDVRPRIPPRTALWKDEYFLCADCDRLFWEGTHWARISRALQEAAGP